MRVLKPLIWVLKLPIALFKKIVILLRSIVLFATNRPFLFLIVAGVIVSAGIYTVDERGLVDLPETLGSNTVDPIGEAEYDIDSNNITDTDVSGDRLPVSAEVAEETESGVPLPDAHPYQKDLYVSVYYSLDVQPLTQDEKEDLQRMFRELDVENPDGTTGIRLHILDSQPNGGQLDETVTSSSDDRSEIQNTYSGYMNDRRCVYHQSVFVSATSAMVGGWGEAPGYFSVVDGTLTRESEDGDFTVRSRALTHEILHNIVGEIEYGQTAGENHVAGSGYLSNTHWMTGGSGIVSPPVARQLSEMGFRKGC